MIIYKVTCLETNKIYIGKTVGQLSRRMSHHYWEARNGGNSYFHNALMKYDRDSFVWEVLDTVMFSDLLFDLEKFYIAKYNCMSPNGYNLTAGGEGATGFIKSAETREKISLANRGRVSKLRGIPLTEETKRKLSLANKGKKKSPESVRRGALKRMGVPLSLEHKKKLSEYHTGRKPSPETIKKLVESHSGKKFSDETREKMSASQALAWKNRRTQQCVN